MGVSLLSMHELEKVVAFSSLGIVHQQKRIINRIQYSRCGQLSASKFDEGHWMDFLTYDGNPTFNVIEKTKEYSSLMDYEEIEKYYDDEYVFRGSIIGPITAKDVRN